MDNVKLPRVMIAGTNSGCGKTTVVCGVLKALINEKLKVSAFKCGPDYIDPMFHSEIIGTPSSNLDIFLTGEKAVKYLFAQNASRYSISVIEGVMGFYDGRGGISNYASSSHLSLLTKTPVILVVDAKGSSLSLCAVIKGFVDFSPNKISGVILNRCSAEMFSLLKKIIEDNIGIKAIGYLPALPDAEIGSRHLGLITAAEIENITYKVQLLGEAVSKCLNLQQIIEIAQSAEPYVYENIDIQPICVNKSIAIAYDKAFCFYYSDNFRLFEKLGAKIIFFSPLANEPVPPEANGLILGGGYPENYAEALSRNTITLNSIQKAIKAGMPTIAECGGFMYLTDKMCGYNMAGVIRGNSCMTKKLNRFGYVKLTANHDNLLCKKGDSIPAHEFHYSDSDNLGDSFSATKEGCQYACIHAKASLFAGYPHMNFWGNTEFAKNFVLSL